MLKKIINKIRVKCCGSAWNYKFSRTKEACVLIVHLKDGTVIRGVYGLKSCVAEAHRGHDIYLEDIQFINDYYVHKKECIFCYEVNDGVWISGKEIEYITFVKRNEDFERED